MANRVLTVLVVLAMVGSAMGSGVVAGTSIQGSDTSIHQETGAANNEQVSDTSGSVERVTDSTVDEESTPEPTTANDTEPDRRYTLINTSTGVSFALEPGAPLADLGVPAGEYLVREYNRTDDGEEVRTFTVTVAADGTVERTASESTDGWGAETTTHSDSNLEVRPTVGFDYDNYPAGSTVNVSLSVVNTSGELPAPVGGTNVTVTVTGPDGQVLERNVTSDSSGSVVVPVNTTGLPEGEYDVDVATDAAASTYGTSFFVGPSVEVYPEFTDHVEVNRTAEVAVALSERGSPVANEQFNVTISRPDGTSEVKTLTTGADGFATLNFTPTEAGDYFIHPTNRPGRGTTLTAGDVLGQIRTNDEEYETNMPAGESVALTGFVTDDGAPAAGEEIVVRIYNTTDSWEGTPVTNITTTTDSYGQYAVDWQTPDVPGAEYEARLFHPDGTRIPNDGGRIDLLSTDSTGGGDGGTAPSASLDTTLLAPSWENVVAPGGTAEALVTASEDGEPAANATVEYVLVYGSGVVAANGTVTTNESGEATIAVDVGADAPDGQNLEIATRATLNGTSVSDTAYGELRKYRIDEERLGTDQPGTTVGYRLTFTDVKTGDPVAGVPMMLSAESMDSLHGSVFGTGTNTSTATGQATIEARLPERATNEYLYGPLYPYFDGGFPTMNVDGFPVSVNGVPDRELEAGETVTVNYTADAVDSTGAIITLRTWEDGVDPAPFSKRVTEGENVTFTVPTVAEDAYYTLRVRAINETGTTALGSSYVQVNGSGDTSGPSTLVVDSDGSGDYSSIQHAVDNASTGQTVEVRPGVYREQVTVDKNISLVAPDGATLNGSSVTGNYEAAIWLQSNATVSGFTIENYPFGIGAGEYDDDWVLHDTTLRNNTVGVWAAYSLGNWTVADTRIVNNTVGVDAYLTSGNWSVRNTTISGSAKPATTSTYDAIPGTGVYAVDTEGSWAVNGSAIVNNSRAGINATGANPWGDATHNWWGNESGPTGDDCVGNVTCADSLSNPPSEGDEDAEAGRLEVRNVTAPSTASVGEEVVVSARVVNTGEANTTQYVTLSHSNGSDGASVLQPVTLAPGESTRISYSFGDGIGVEDTYTAAISTDNETASTDVEFVDRRLVCGVSWGDPHFVTFDGVSYDFQGVGEFVLVDEPGENGTTIQVRQVPVSGSTSVSVTNATATVVDGHRVEIDASAATPLRINGTPTALASGERISVGNGEVRRSGDTYTVIYPGEDGEVDSSDERLRVDVIGDRLDLEACLDPDRSGDAEGLLGTPNGNSSDDLRLENGTVLRQPVDTDVLYGAFRDDWRVSNETSVFTYEDGNGPSTFYDPNFPEQIVTLSDLNDTVRERGEALALEAGLEPGTATFRDAVIDYALTGDSDYFASARMASTRNVSSDATEPGDLTTELRLAPRTATVARNGTVTYDVVLTDAYGGVGAVQGTVGVTNDTAAEITNASVNGGDEESLTTVNVSEDGSAVYFDGALLDTADRGGVVIATVTVKGTTPGETGLNLTIDAVGNESGVSYNVTAVEDGSLNVTRIGQLRDAYSGPPTDPDGDGVFEDLNGDGEVNIVDVQALYTVRDDETVKQNVAIFDVNGDGDVDIADVQALYADQYSGTGTMTR